MPKEVLAGAVLDLHQRSETLAQTMWDLSETALRVKDERDAAVKLLRTVLDMRELGAEGPTKSNIRAFLARIGQPVTINRFARQQALEREISAFNADPGEAVELLQAISGALGERYGKDRARDVLQCIGETEEALSELERTLADLDPADASSGRIARQMERAQR
jgi:hypothetical protein